MDSVAQVINYEVIKAFLLATGVFTYNRLMNLSNISFFPLSISDQPWWNSTEKMFQHFSLWKWFASKGLSLVVSSQSALGQYDDGKCVFTPDL